VLIGVVYENIYNNIHGMYNPYTQQCFLTLPTCKCILLHLHLHVGSVKQIEMHLHDLA
jgi:hypothetical protein